MPKSRTEKENIVKQLTDRFNRIKAAVFVDYSGLTVKDVENLRKSLRKEKIDYLVAKKTLIRRAIKETDLKGIDIDSLLGQIAIVFGYADEVLPARILKNFQKENQNLKLIGGILENKFINDAKVIELAAVPPREELLARLVGSLNAPLTNLVRVLQGNLKNLVFVLSRIKEQKS